MGGIGFAFVAAESACAGYAHMFEQTANTNSTTQRRYLPILESEADGGIEDAGRLSGNLGA